MTVRAARNSIDAAAMMRVQKARAELILTRRFYGVLVSNVEPVICRHFPTAATNGHQHYWNPEFVMSLTNAELLFVQCHECEHNARHHGTRRASRDPVEWNVAGDYSINIDLVAEKIGTPPKGALINAKYAGMASEDIYRCRELDEKARAGAGAGAAETLTATTQAKATKATAATLATTRR